MRLLSVALVLGLAVGAAAQEPPPASEQPYPIVEPAPPPPAMGLTPPTLTVSRPPLTRQVVSRWHGARALTVTGGVIGLVSTGLALSSTIYVLATGYPPSAGDFVHPARPSDTGPVLAYVASATSALGFALSAGGLGWEHQILGQLGADPGRGIYIGGSVVGILGLVAIGAGYFLGFTDYLDSHDQSIAVLSTTLGGSALCSTASALFAKDSSRMKKVWKNLSTF